MFQDYPGPIFQDYPGTIFQDKADIRLDNTMDYLPVFFLDNLHCASMIMENPF